ncbi:hypothetical protein BVRB_6g142190 [Beta vulgaris subsp. vulgaris]|nr:hypothetical protein BVRB_6g142190 [Beta vulgaris subsp. vulgaris]
MGELYHADYAFVNEAGNFMDDFIDTYLIFLHLVYIFVRHLFVVSMVEVF